MKRCLSILLAGLSLTGCAYLPDISHQPMLHNPFPQLSTVAITPFINHSSDQTLDGGQFAEAYFNELQAVRGFDVIPLSVVERAMLENNIALEGPEDARRLAQILGADATVIGAITDFSPYYPPRCGLRVEWYAANPSFHPIPPGYGLPWGTPEEEQIPGSLVFEAEFALAKAQLETQTPEYEPLAAAPRGREYLDTQMYPDDNAESPPGLLPFGIDGAVNPISYRQPINDMTGATDTIGPSVLPGSIDPSLPANWPDPRGFIPPPPRPTPAQGKPSSAPVMQLTRIYHGDDSEFTEALASYHHFRDDARLGAWQTSLERSDDFIRFCCRMHIWEMFSARGGAGETRVVWRWPEVR